MGTDPQLQLATSLVSPDDTVTCTVTATDEQVQRLLIGRGYR